MADIERTLTTVHAEIARATYHDDMPAEVQDRILALVREAVGIDRRERARLRGAVEALRRIAAGHAHPAKLAGEVLDALPPDDNVYDPPYVERGR